MNNKINIIVFSLFFSIVIWVSVTLSEQFFSSIELNVKVVNQPEGYTCGAVEPKTVNVKIKAKGWQILTYYLGQQNSFLISADNDSGKINFDPNKAISENVWLSAGMNVLEITPRNISFRVEKLIYKKLAITADTDLSFADGYNLATPISISPDSIIVSGPSSILNKLTSIKTKLVSLSELDSRMKVPAEIEELSGFNFERSRVELSFDVQRIVEKPFDKIKVNITDIPRDRDVVLMPNTIDISLRGGINLLGRINSDQIIATINYSDIVFDTLGYIRPSIKIPSNTKLVFVKPARLNYIIKKFE